MTDSNAFCNDEALEVSLKYGFGSVQSIAGLNQYTIDIPSEDVLSNSQFNFGSDSSSSCDTGVDECVICLEPLEQFSYYKFDCSHRMHRLCFKDYFKFNYDYEKNYVRCPLCASKLPTERVLTMAKSDDSLIRHFHMHDEAHHEVLLGAPSSSSPSSFVRVSDNLRRGLSPSCREVLPMFYPVIVFSALFFSTYLLLAEVGETNRNE